METKNLYGETEEELRQIEEIKKDKTILEFARFRNREPRCPDCGAIKFSQVECLCDN